MSEVANKVKEIIVEKLGVEAGSEVVFDEVLLIENNGKVTVGTPTIENAKVVAKVVKEETGAHLLYFLTNDKRAAIAKMLNSPAFVDIVSSVEFKSENYKLTEIIDEAFVGNDTNLNAINFDENSELEKIGAHVFSTQNLTKLQVGDTEKEIPTTVSYIGPNTSFKNTSWYKIKQLDDFVYLNLFI